MRKAMHTPGPWEVKKTGKPSKQIFAGDELIATIRHFSNGVDDLGPLPSQARANARLIAIAPEMYRELENLKTLLEEALGYAAFEVDELIFKQAIRDIETLLAKAEGKEDAHENN